MSRKIPQIWGKKGAVRISDVGWGFFVVKFDSVEDYERAMFGGPWMVILKRIGDRIGTTVRIDHTTLEGARGNYARICVEVDLSKPLLSKYRLRRRVRRIEYECLHTICFGCGCYGHEESACPVAVAMEEAPSLSFSNPVFVSADTEGERPEVQEDFGPWMKVRRQPCRSEYRKQTPVVVSRIGATPASGETPAKTSAQSSVTAGDPIGVKEKGKSNNSFQILEDLGEGTDCGEVVLASPNFIQRSAPSKGNKENVVYLGSKPNQGPKSRESGKQHGMDMVIAKFNQGPKSNKDKAISGPCDPKGNLQKNSARAGLSGCKSKEASKPGLKKPLLAGTRAGEEASKNRDQSACKTHKPHAGAERIEGLGGSKLLGGSDYHITNGEFVLVEDITMEEVLPSQAAVRPAA
ncbi:hypothetical protein LINPERHAP2_LOCUS40159 [Linum perenne]